MGRDPNVVRRGLFRWSYVAWSPDGLDMIYGVKRTRRSAQRSLKRLLVWH
jgi:hypothetical protein